MIFFFRGLGTTLGGCRSCATKPPGQVSESKGGQCQYCGLGDCRQVAFWSVFERFGHENWAKTGGDNVLYIPWVVPPPRMPVTTRIITFLVGDSYKPSFATVTGRGGQRVIYTLLIIITWKASRNEAFL